MIITANWRQLLKQAHPWISERQITRLLRHVYITYTEENSNRKEVQQRMDRYTFQMCAVSQKHLQHHVAFCEEWDL